MSAGTVEAPPQQTLARRGAVALGWAVLASAAKILLTLGVQALLARLLTPSDFGLFAIGMLVIGLAGYFADIGIATSLVQKAEINDDDIRFVFTLNLLISAGVALLIFVAAGALAQLFDKPQAAAVFRAMAPVFVLNAAASVSTSLLRRSLDYRHIQLSGLAGYIVGFGIVGVGLAWSTGTVVALVAAFAVQSLVTLAALYARTRHPVGLSLKAPDRGSHLGFGLTVLATNVVNWMAGAVDRLLIGRLFSSASLGFYTAAYNLIHAPVNVLYPNLQSIVFATTARMQGERERLATVYLELLQGVTVLVLSAFAGVSLLAGPLVLTIYGPAWAEAATYAGIFSLMAPFLLVWGISTPLLWNTGRKTLEATVQLPFIVAAVFAISAAGSVSMVAVGWTAAALFMARTALIVVLVLRALGIGAGRALRHLLPAMLLAPWVGCSVWAGEHFMAVASWPAPLRLCGGLLLLAIALFTGLIVAPKMLPPTLRAGIARWHYVPLFGAVARRLSLRSEPS